MSQEIDKKSNSMNLSTKFLGNIFYITILNWFGDF